MNSLCKCDKIGTIECATHTHPCLTDSAIDWQRFVLALSKSNHITDTLHIHTNSDRVSLVETKADEWGRESELQTELWTQFKVSPRNNDAVWFQISQA